MALLHLLPTKNKQRFELQNDLSAGNTSTWIALNSLHDRRALCSCHPGASGTMRMEYTLDTLEIVDTGSPEFAIWDAGDTSESTGRQLPTNVTAIRFIATTDDGKYRVVA